MTSNLNSSITVPDIGLGVLTSHSTIPLTFSLTLLFSASHDTLKLPKTCIYQWELGVLEYDMVFMYKCT